MSAYTALETAGLFKPVGGLVYQTTAPISWAVGKVDSGWIFTVDAGAKFDVSIPWALRWAFSPHDPRFLKAAALHDEMLKAGFDRLTSAAVFNDALKADGVGASQRLAMTAAVAFYRWQ